MSENIPSTGLKVGEKVLWYGKPSYAAFSGRIILGSIFLLLGFIPFVGFIFFVIGFIILASVIIKVRSLTYTVTNMRIVRERRFLGRDISETTLDRVTDIVFHQGFFGRALNFGAVHFHTAGTGFPGIKFEGAPDPMTLRGIVINAKDEYLKSVSGNPP